MGDDSQIVDSLIRDINREDPRLAQALRLINLKLRDLNLQLNPLFLQQSLEEIAASGLTPPATFTFSFTPRTIRFNWDPVDGAAQYEVRRGTVWETATLQFRSLSLQADIDPLLIGSYTFLIKSISSTGTYSTLSTSLTLSIPIIPAVLITAQVIDNNVLLFWNEPESSFVIDFYEVFKDGVSLGTLDGTFISRFETISGTFHYSVIAVDIAGNESVPAVIVATVTQPPDFQLFDSLQSDYGTLTNMRHHDSTPLFGDGSPLGFIIGPANTTESWEDHFINNGFSNIDDQVTAGYPLYLQPILVVGSFEDVLDFGTVLNNVIATLTYNKFLYTVDDVTVLVQMKVSLDNITYSAYTSGSVQFFSSFRYLKLKMTFTPTTTKALLNVSSVFVRLDVKREQDGGIVAAVSTDVGGTTVNFIKSFKDIDSIDVSAMGTVFGTAIVDFVDAPNPTSFKVLVFDGAGVRISASVRWIARGIV